LVYLEVVENERSFFIWQIFENGEMKKNKGRKKYIIGP
jgi:hypothetical protein